MEIQTVKKMQKEALKGSGFDFIRLGAALFFMVVVLSYSLWVQVAYLTMFSWLSQHSLVMNIGANDVSNNVGPAVGSKALTMGGAILSSRPSGVEPEVYMKQQEERVFKLLDTIGVADEKWNIHLNISKSIYSSMMKDTNLS